jgi:hypothetical protein
VVTLSIAAKVLTLNLHRFKQVPHLRTKEMLKLLLAISLAQSSAIPTFKLGLNTAASEQDDARGAFTTLNAFKQGQRFIRDLQPSWEDFDVEFLIYDNKGSSGKAVKGAVEFWFGTNTVNAMIGCSWSSLSMAVGSLGQTMEQVQMGYSSTNARLSNKQLYSYFLRTVPPDSLQSIALVKMVEYLGYTRISWAYAAEPYAEGLYRGFVDESDGKISIQNAEPLVQQQEIFDGSLWIDGLTRLSKGAEKVILVAGNTGTAHNFMMFAIEIGLYAEDRLILQAEGAAAAWDLLTEEQSIGARGSIGVMPVSKGTKYPTYVEFLKTTTKDDLPPPFSTTLWDKFGWTDEVHASGKTYFYEPFIVDGVIAYLISFNTLLKEGYAVEDIKGKLLLENLRQLTFDGVSGNVWFNEDGDRLADFEVWNTDGTGTLNVVGVWGARTGVTLDSQLYFPDGTSNPTPMLPPKCPAGKARPSPSEPCRECTNGLVYNDNTEDCQPCDAGKGLVNAVGEFLLPGARLREEGVACDFCREGFYSNKTESQDKDSELRVCMACPAGEMTQEIGQTQCVSCQKGFYRGSTDVVCQRCPIGQYTEREGQTACQTCGKLLTTLFQGSDSRTHCVCQENYYLPLANESSCQRCKEGMTCKAGSAVKNYGKPWSEEAGYPTLNPQHWSSKLDPLSVFLCEGPEVCPGGMPGDCPANLEGMMCSQCAPGWRRTGDACQRCTDIETSKLLFPVLPLLFGPIIVALLYSRNRDKVEEWGTWNNGIAALFLLLLNHYQMVGLIQGTKLQLTSSVKDYWEVFTYLNSLLSILSPDCAGLEDFRVSYIVGALAPLIVAGIFFEAFVVAFLVSTFKPALRMDVDHTFNLYCSLLFAFYVAVCKGSIDVFLCDDHPNDIQTLSRAPYIYCGSDDHSSMLGVGVFALAAFCVLTGAIFSYQLWIAPEVFHQEYFQKRWKFLVMKYRPDVWWWGTVWLLKGLLMNLVLLSTTSFGQLFGLFFIMCGYLITTVSYYPWRHTSANMFERQVCVSILLIAFLALCNHTFKFRSPEAETWCFIISCSPMVVFACLCVGLIAETNGRVQQWTQARYELVALHLQRSFASMVNIKKEDLVSVLSMMTPSDRCSLANAADVILAEFCGQQARQSRVRQRLIANQKKMIPDSIVNGVVINRHVEHPTAECQFLRLDEALPTAPAIESLKLIVGLGLQGSTEALSRSACSISEDMYSERWAKKA